MLQGVLSVLLLLAACRCTVLVRFVQFRRFPQALRAAFSKTPNAGGVTTAQATATALAATVGTGNIAGAAGAVILGGPGAVLWMVVSALAGAAAKYLEIALAKRCHSGAPGPLSYIVAVRGRAGRLLTCTYAAMLPLCALCTGNLVQVNTAAESLTASLRPLLTARMLRFAPLICGALFFALALPPLLGGAKRIGRAAETLVPLMSGLYLAFALLVIAVNAAALPGAVRAVLRGAGSPRAFTVGMARGMCSHESGFGTAPLAHENAAGSPHTEGLCGVFEVFFDTVVMCTLTALALLTSGVPLPGAEAEVSGSLMQAAFSTVYGQGLSAAVIAACMALFAFTSALTYGLYGGQCVRYLFGRAGERVYLVLFAAAMPLGACLAVSAAWKAAEWAGYLLAVINFSAMFAVLGGKSKGKSRKTHASAEAYALPRATYPCP